MNAITHEIAAEYQSPDLLDRLDALMQSDEDGLRVSIYCPAGRLPDEAKAAMIAFKNQVGNVTEELEKAGDSGSGVLKRLKHMLPEVAGTSFWNQQLGGIAIFVENQRSELFKVSAPLPECSRVGYEFYLKPLLALGSNLNIYHLLAISQNDVRLYRGSALGLREIHCPGLAESYAVTMADIGYPADSKKQAASQSNFKASEEELRVFLNRLEDAVSKHLSGSELPLLLAGDRIYESMYREVNTYPHLSDSYVAGNPEHRSTRELGELAEQALHSDFIKSQSRALGRFKRLDEAPISKVAKGLEEILNASARGQVESAFLPADADVWGTFDPDAGKFTAASLPSVADDELYELNAITAS